MVISANLRNSRVSGPSEAVNYWISRNDRGGSAEEEDDIDALDNAPISYLLKSRNHQKSGKRKNEIQAPVLVLSDYVQVLDLDSESGDEIVREGDGQLGELEVVLSPNVTIFRDGDLVWAKIMPSVWWPGWICRKMRRKVLVSFFNCTRSRYFRKSEIVGFEKNFQAMSKIARGRSLDAIDSALAELGRRLILGLTCPCQSVLGEYKGEGQKHLGEQIVKSKEKVFEPVEVLRFVHLVAMSPWIDGAEALSAVRNGAQLNAFRCYSSIKCDWIYFQTMRLSESGSVTNELEPDSGTCMEMQNDHSSDTGIAQSVIQEADVLGGGQKDRHNIFLEQVEGDSGICKAKKEEHLHEILTHLCCLALDPFYTGTRELHAENSISVCQKILKFRDLVYEKNLDPIPGKRTRYSGYKVEIGIENKIYRLNSVSHVGGIAGETLLENKVGIASGDGTIESGLSSNVLDSSKAVVDERREEAKADCSLAHMEELPAVEDAVAMAKHTTDNNGEIQIKNTWRIFGPNSMSQLYETISKISTENAEKKSSRVESVLFPGCTTTETQHKFSDTKNDDTHGFSLPHIQEDLAAVQHCYVNCTDGRNTDVEVDFSLNHALDASRKEVFEDGMNCDDRAGSQSGTTRKSCQSSHLRDNLSRSHPRNEIGSVANIAKRRTRLEMASEDRSEGKSRPSQSAASNLHVDLQQDKPPCSWKMLYASPLTNSPVSSVNATFLSSKTNIHSECPTLLHMKFPKDFKLPSKDDLLKQFRPFGPLDHAKTRVFFYTGSAQVVFLHHLDAEAAYHYAKRKKIFYGRANVRFWLGQCERSREGAAKVPAPVSFSTVASSASSLKSCLKTSNVDEKKTRRKLQQVKFTTGTQISSLSDAMRNHGAFMLPDSCEFDSEVGQNISEQMLVLLERCHQLVSTLRENSGLKSYYSMFTRGKLEWDPV